MTIVRYFIGKTNGIVFGIYRGIFEGKKIVNESKWQLPNGSEWQDTQAVSEWNFLGSDLIEPISDKEAQGYLPNTKL
jgi:hypothetical protein